MVEVNEISKSEAFEKKILKTRKLRIYPHWIFGGEAINTSVFIWRLFWDISLESKMQLIMCSQHLTTHKRV